MADLFRQLRQRWRRKLPRGLAQLIAATGLAVLAVACAGGQSQPTIKSAPAAQAPADSSSKYCATGPGTGIIPVLHFFKDPEPAKVAELSGFHRRQLAQIQQSLDRADAPAGPSACFGSSAIASVASQCAAAVRSAALGKEKSKDPIFLGGPEFVVMDYRPDANGRLGSVIYELKAAFDPDKVLAKRRVSVSISYGPDRTSILSTVNQWLISHVSC